MEQRRSRRFQLRLPLSITRTGADPTALAGVTKNISSCGVLFTAVTPPDPGGAIEYVISLQSDGPQRVNLRCVGKVLRSERQNDERRSWQIAATLERYEFIRARELAAGPKL